MSNIQKTLDSLQPYVIGIRYLEGTVLVDAVFKEGWTILEDPNIKRVKGDESMNYYMLFSESPNIGLDGLLGYVEKTIKLNLEKEKKHDLLRVKVNELKEIFKTNSLLKLNRLKFVFTDEDLVPNLNEFDIDIDDEDDIPVISTPSFEESYEEEVIEETANIPTSQPVAYLDENHNPIELTDEEQELLEEEARAERNRRMTQNRKKPTTPTPTRNLNKVELPPKRKVEMMVTESDYQTDCDCGPDEACDKCIDSKGY